MKKTHSWALAALLSFGLATQTNAQNGEASEEANEVIPEKGKHISGGFGFFHLGYGLQSLENLNTEIAPMGFPGFKDNALFMGGSGLLMVKNFMLGGEGAGNVEQKLTAGGKVAKFDAGYGQFNLGYAVWEHKGLLFYPKIGVGGYNQKVFLKNDSLPTSFGGAVANPGAASQLVRKGMLLTGELNFNFMPGFDEASGGGMVLGLAVGYRYQASAKSWELWDEPVSGGPDLNMSGLYFKLNIGSGGYTRQ